jgi:hypothetical protein
VIANLGKRLARRASNHYVGRTSKIEDRFMNLRQPDIAYDGLGLGEIKPVGRRSVGVVIDATKHSKAGLAESLRDSTCTSEQVDDGEWWLIGRAVAACVLHVFCSERHSWILTFYLACLQWSTDRVHPVASPSVS